MVICDPGFLPGYITLLGYLLIFILVHFLIIKPMLKNKVKLSKQICRKVFFLKGKEKLVQNLLPVIIFMILLFLMFFAYPELTSHNCPHKFWRLFGIDTL